MTDIVSMMITSSPSVDDIWDSDDEDEKETYVIFPSTNAPIFTILQQNNATSIESSDDDSENHVCKQCKSGIIKYKRFKPKISQIITILIH